MEGEAVMAIDGLEYGHSLERISRKGNEIFEYFLFSFFLKSSVLLVQLKKLKLQLILIKMFEKVKKLDYFDYYLIKRNKNKTKK